MLVARISWLDWPLQWSGGRLVWTDGQRTLSPSVDDLATAVRCLNKLATYPIAARAVLGDVDAWIETKRHGIELVRRLRNVDVSDASGCVGAWVEALIAEAIALDHCTTSAAAELVRAGSEALPSLSGLLNDSHLATDVHRLASLVVGAIDRRTHAGYVPRAKVDHDCYRYGFEFGLPTNVRATLALLACGFDLAVRYDIVKVSTRSFALPTADLDRLIGDGVAPRNVVEIAEALVDAEAVASEIRRISIDMADLNTRRGTKRYELLENYYREHADELVAQTRQIFHRCSLRLRIPRATRAALSLVTKLLDAPYHGNDRLRNIFDILAFANSLLTGAETLPDHLYADLVEWVASRHNHPDPLVKDVVDAAIRLATRSKSIELVNRAFAIGALYKLQSANWEPDAFAIVLDTAEQVADCGHSLIELASQCASGGVVKTTFPVLARNLKRLDPEVWKLVIDAIQNERWHSGLPFGTYLEFVTPLIPYIATNPSRFPDTATETSRECAEYFTESLLKLASVLRGQSFDTIKSELTWYREHMVRLIGKITADRLYDSIDTAVRVAALMDRPSAVHLRSLVTAAAGRRFDDSSRYVGDGFAFVRKHPAIAYIVTNNFIRQPQRCLNLVAAMSGFQGVVPVGSGIFDSMRLFDLPRGATPEDTRTEVAPASAVTNEGAFVTIAEYLGYATEPDRRLTDIDTTPVDEYVVAFDTPEPARYLTTGVTPITPDASWYRLCARFPESTPDVVEYLQLAAVAGISLEIPKSLRRIVDIRERAAREIGHLTQAIAATPDRDDLRKRLARCQTHLHPDAQTISEQRLAVSKALDNLVADVQLAAVESLVNRVYRRHLITIAGPDLATQVPEVVSSDMRNAVALAMSIRTNRKLLIRLIRSCLSGDDTWSERHPANVALLSKLVNVGVDAALWLSDFPRRYRCEDIEGGWVYLRVERDPLRILQMGNSFNTCLSRGGINAFSTVANACELNKRVIFGYDANGRIVARKLIGLNEEFGLLGYHAYTNDSRGHGSAALRSLVNQYARTFADACGLQLANSGAIPKLLAQAWYDDGYHSWGYPESVTAASDGAVGGREGRIPPFRGCPREALQGTITT